MNFMYNTSTKSWLKSQRWLAQVKTLQIDVVLELHSDAEGTLDLKNYVLLYGDNRIFCYE